jgi:excisionase family DNA binding protein
MKPQREPLLTVKDVATRCNQCERQVRRHIEGKRLKAVRLGRSVRIRPEDLEDFINGK